MCTALTILLLYQGLIWETMALVQGKDLKQLPIVFEDVRFERATNIPEQGRPASESLNQDR